MEMGIDIKKIKDFFSSGRCRKSFCDFISRQIRTLICVIAAALSAYCVYVWYGTIYKPEWDESQKQEYIKNKDRGTIFNKAKFEEIVSETEGRKVEFEKNVEGLKDIFQVKK